MANNDEWHLGFVASPDDVFEARLAEQEMQRNTLYEIYTIWASLCLHVRRYFDGQYKIPVWC
jgi:hypothetical protein